MQITARSLHKKPNTPDEQLTAESTWALADIHTKLFDWQFQGATYYQKIT